MVVGSIVATSALGAALVSLAPGADAAPYPPTQPCSLTATARGPASDGGTTSYDVLGSGLGPEQPVRVVQVATGQQVGSARTDENGNFRTIVTAPADADASAPDLTASSPRQTCTSNPPPGTTPPTPSSTQPNPTNTSPTRGTTSTGSGAGTGTGGTGAAGGTGGAGGNPVPSGAGGSAGPGAASSGSASGGSSPTGGAGNGTSAPTSSAPATSGTNPTDGRTSSAPLAEPSPGTDTPFGIGLGIAAILLVLGTLAVLLLTRRPER